MIDIKINKELLSEVFNKKVFLYNTHPLRNDYIRIFFSQDRYLPDCEDINIYELAYKLQKYYDKKNRYFSFEECLNKIKEIK